MLLDISPERGQQCIQTHFSLVALQRVQVVACIVLECHERLEQLAVLLCKLVAIRVLLDLTLTVQALATPALEWVDLVA
jgi:hypothetical protein